MMNGGENGFTEWTISLRYIPGSRGITSRTCPLIWVFMICDCRKREPRKRSWRRNMEFTVSATTITGSMGEGYWKDRCARSWKAESRIFLFAYVGRTKIGRGGGMGKT